MARVGAHAPRPAGHPNRNDAVGKPRSSARSAAKIRGCGNAQPANERATALWIPFFVIPATDAFALLFCRVVAFHEEISSRKKAQKAQNRAPGLWVFFAPLALFCGHPVWSSFRCGFAALCLLRPAGLVETWLRLRRAVQMPVAGLALAPTDAPKLLGNTHRVEKLRTQLEGRRLEDRPIPHHVLARNETHHRGWLGGGRGAKIWIREVHRGRIMLDPHRNKRCQKFVQKYQEFFPPNQISPAGENPAPNP